MLQCYYAAVLLCCSCCSATVLLCCCAAVLLYLCAAVLLCCSATVLTVLQCYCATVLLSCSATVLLCFSALVFQCHRFNSVTDRQTYLHTEPLLEVLADLKRFSRSPENANLRPFVHSFVRLFGLSLSGLRSSQSSSFWLRFNSRALRGHSKHSGNFQRAIRLCHTLGA